MSYRENWRSVPIPHRMQGLPKDRRGYPIPEVVFRDRSGNPQFAINDDERRRRIIDQDLCAVCGQKLTRGRWFIGGVLPAFHEFGAYVDPPTHNECAHYALQVCPFLAVPGYHNVVGAKNLEWDQVEVGSAIAQGDAISSTQPNLFVAVQATATKVVDDGAGGVLLRPGGKIMATEFWRGGGQVPRDEAEPLVVAELARAG